MQKPGDLPARGILHHGVQPGHLRCLLAVSAAEQHGVEPDEAKMADILHPPVRTEIAPPTHEPLISDWLPGVSGIAHIVIAGNCAKADSETAHQLGRVSQIVVDIGAVDSDVAGVNDKVRVLRGDPRCERRPIVREMRLRTAQMGV